MVGKIFLAKIFFTDYSDFKLRPIVIVQEYKNEDYLYLPLTTNLEIGGIEITTKDLVVGALYKPSVAIIPKLSIIHKSFLVKELGTLHPNTMKKINSELCKNLGCSL